MGVVGVSISAVRIRFGCASLLFLVLASAVAVGQEIRWSPHRGHRVHVSPDATHYAVLDHLQRTITVAETETHDVVVEREYPGIWVDVEWIDDGALLLATGGTLQRIALEPFAVHQIVVANGAAAIERISDDTVLTYSRGPKVTVVDLSEQTHTPYLLDVRFLSVIMVFDNGYLAVGVKDYERSIMSVQRLDGTFQKVEEVTFESHEVHGFSTAKSYFRLPGDGGVGRLGIGDDYVIDTHPLSMVEIRNTPPCRIVEVLNTSAILSGADCTVERSFLSALNLRGFVNLGRPPARTMYHADRLPDGSLLAIRGEAPQ